MLDINEFDMTADGLMVRIDMADPAMRANEPTGRFMDVEQAIMLEARGLLTMRKKGEKRMTNTQLQDDRVMVEYLEPILIASYGRYGIYNRKRAELGIQAGKWKVVSLEQMKSDDGGVKRERTFLLNAVEEQGLKEIGKRKIAWIQDALIIGGAELSNKLVIKVGIDCGYEISVVTSDMVPEVMKQIIDQSDLIIVNNVWSFTEQQMFLISKAIYTDKKPYVKYEHDHRELQRKDFSERLFKESRLNVFISPVHFKNHQEVLGCDGVVLPLAIDVDFFKPVEGVKRNPNTALVCNVRNFKGWEALQGYIDSHPEIKFTVMTERPPVQGSNVIARAKVPYERMPALYSEFEYLVHLLDGWGAGERVIFEAALCGCKIISNERVGHMSWNKDLTDVEGLRKWLIQAPYEFWRVIERKILC